mmetsp:Transcript_16074/g.48841  ORF Transcript_16074/g.48841 Transcript_16074/m.48841 type:complete len:263 (-) Transcript_16074:214-1002(-)|eukprot:scaffold305026_cov28-Tisochrysis_lutea.AAC.1
MVSVALEEFTRVLTEAPVLELFVSRPVDVAAAIVVEFIDPYLRGHVKRISEPLSFAYAREPERVPRALACVPCGSARVGITCCLRLKAAQRLLAARVAVARLFEDSPALCIVCGKLVGIRERSHGPVSRGPVRKTQQDARRRVAWTWLPAERGAHAQLEILGFNVVIALALAILAQSTAQATNQLCAPCKSPEDAITHLWPRSPACMRKCMGEIRRDTVRNPDALHGARELAACPPEQRRQLSRVRCRPFRLRHRATTHSAH